MASSARRIASALAGATVWGMSRSALACPFCSSDTGEQVRAGIFNADFGYNALTALLPFAVLLIIIGLIHGEAPWSRSSPSSEQPEDVPTQGGKRSND